MKSKKLCAATLAAVLCAAGAFPGHAAVNEAAAKKAIRDANLESVRKYTENSFVPVLTTATYEQYSEYAESGQVLVSFLFDNDFGYRWEQFYNAHGDITAADVDLVELTETGYTARILLTGTNDDTQMALYVNFDDSMIPISTTLSGYSKEEDEKEQEIREAIKAANIQDVKTYTENGFGSLFASITYEQFVEYAAQGQILMSMTFDNDLGYHWKQFVEAHGNIKDSEIAACEATGSGYECTMFLTGEDGEQEALTIEYDKAMRGICTTLGDTEEFEEEDVMSGVESMVESASENVEEIAEVESTAEEVVFTHDVKSVEDLTITHYADIAIADYGTITVALDETKAPETVRNFVELAESGFYDGLKFHRIIEGFMMQGGDPDATGAGGSGKEIKGEFSANGVNNPISHVRGAISMARAYMPDSASSQFFIVHKDSTFLDGEYAAFGFVTEGIEIVDAVCTDAQPTDDNGTIEPDAMPVIESVTIREP